ncbi:D-amino acid aminotransferase [Endozoicomonadaceae bacterium StTr2]
MSIVYLNGEYLPQQEARISVMDRGFLFGDGVYEVVPVFNGHLFRWEQHLNRLQRSLTEIRIDLDWDNDKWQKMLRTLLLKNPGRTQTLYIQVTRGAGVTRRHGFPAEAEPTVFAMLSPLDSHLPDSLDKVSPIHAITLQDHRWQRCDIKSISLLGNVLHHQEALDAKVDEAILLNARGELTEGSATNVFVVKDGEISTPPADRNILGGVTRDLAIELINTDARYTCHERIIPKDELFLADEVWITSSNREILPVGVIDGCTVGTGQPGAVWHHVAGLYQAFRQQSGNAGLKPATN